MESVHHHSEAEGRLLCFLSSVAEESPARARLGLDMVLRLLLAEVLSGEGSQH